MIPLFFSANIININMRVYLFLFMNIFLGCASQQNFVMHKQNATIIATKQEKVRKRFLTQLFSNSKNLPSIPDTPEKSRPDLNQKEQTKNEDTMTKSIKFAERNLL